MDKWIPFGLLVVLGMSAMAMMVFGAALICELWRDRMWIMAVVACIVEVGCAGLLATIIGMILSLKG